MISLKLKKKKKWLPRVVESRYKGETNIKLQIDGRQNFSILLHNRETVDDGNILLVLKIRRNVFEYFHHEEVIIIRGSKYADSCLNIIQCTYLSKHPRILWIQIQFLSASWILKHYKLELATFLLSISSHFLSPG